MAKTRSVMSTKRVTGPSANSILTMHVRLERCSTKGCKNAPLITKNPTGVKKVRVCEACMSGNTPSKAPDLHKLLSLGAYHTRG